MNKTQSIEQRCKIGSWLNSFSLIERLVRSEPRCAAKINEASFIISYNGYVLNYCIITNTIVVEHQYGKGMKNPLSFLVVENDGGEDNTIFYGEYIWNGSKGPVAIYKRNQDSWNKVYEFPSNTIQHIHSIVKDSYRNCFLILTGDKDEESGIWIADFGFKRVEPLLIGKQIYRACVAFPVRDGIVYATDTPLEDNYIYHVVIEDMAVKKVEVEYLLNGPCIYGTSVGGSFYFSSSVEPDSSLPTSIYRMTYKLGEGVKSRFSHVVKRNENGEYSEVLKTKKDILPIWLFQFGNVLFPYNETDRVVVVMQSTVDGHGKTYEIE